jgi:putative transcriptional regulator
MNRIELIQKTRNILAKAGFYISEETDSRIICFDIVARRDNTLVIFKILSNIDSFSKFNANQLSIISTMLGGVPILIGGRNSKKEIESGIVYLRYGIPIFNTETLEDYFINGVQPLIFSAPGGFYVNINGEALREARENKNISLGRLAKVAGVSRKAIQMYEGGMSTMIDIALRLEEFLDIPLVQPLNPFSGKENPDHNKEIRFEIVDNQKTQHEVFQQLRTLGYNVIPTIQCPFDALTKDSEVLLITGVGEKDKNSALKARAMTNISKITEQYSVIFMDKTITKDNLEGTPIIKKAELAKMDDGEDIITLISERS